LALQIGCILQRQLHAAAANDSNMYTKKFLQLLYFLQNA